MMAKDNFSFSAESNPLSETGFLNVFAPHDVVQAVGGPKKFAAMYAEAKLLGKEGELMEGFEGRFPEEKKRRKRATSPVLGEHTAAVVESSGEQPELF